MYLKSLFLSGCFVTALLTTAAMAADLEGLLKKPETVSHDSYRAAKYMCLHSVHSHKDKLGDKDAISLAALCSKGRFDKVIQKLGVDLEQDVTIVTRENGQERVSKWEKDVMDTLKHYEIIDQHNAHKGGKE